MPQTSKDESHRTPEPRGSRRPSPTVVALALLGIVVVVSVVVYVLVGSWIG